MAKVCGLCDKPMHDVDDDDTGLIQIRRKPNGVKLVVEAHEACIEEAFNVRT